MFDDIGQPVFSYLGFGHFDSINEDMTRMEFNMGRRGLPVALFALGDFTAYDAGRYYPRRRYEYRRSRREYS